MKLAQCFGPVILLLTLACAPTVEEPLDPPSADLPSLREVPLNRLPGDAVRNLASPVTASELGHLVTLPPGGSPEGHVLLLMDSTGNPMQWIARRGAGPGEVSLPSFTSFIGDSLLAVWDMASARLSVFNLNGTLAAERTFDQTQSPLAINGDSLDIRWLQNSGRSEWVRVSWRDGGHRLLIAANDTAFGRAFPDQGSSSRPVVRGNSYASGQGRLVLADARDYVMLIYSEGGRHLGRIDRTQAPVLPGLQLIRMESLAVASQPVSDGQKSQLLERFRRRPLPAFQRVRIDGRGRLWVIRTDGIGAWADLFADTVHLGTIAIPCLGFSGQNWDVADRWLAISCINESPDAASDGTVRMFRIDG